MTAKMIKLNPAWQGSLDDLVTEVIDQLTPFDRSGGKLKEVNARLIRYYISQKAMSRPRRKATDKREVEFQWRHVLECMVIRVLLNEGWPLTRIIDWVPYQDEAGLVALLPTELPKLDDPRQQVQALVANFRQQTVEKPVLPTQRAMVAATQERLQLRQKLQALGTPDGQVRTDHLLRLCLAPGCEVLLSAPWWEALDDARIERVAEVFKQVLREESIKRGPK